MKLDELRRWVTWNLACGVMTEIALPVVGDDGGSPVVVALEDEALSTLLGRLRAVGGFANLFVGAENRVRMLSVIDANCAVPESDDDLTAIGETPGATATVGMFVDYVAQRPNGVVLAIVSGDANRPALARDARTVEFAATTS